MKKQRNRPDMESNLFLPYYSISPWWKFGRRSKTKGSIPASHSPSVGSYPSFVHSALAPQLGRVWNHPTDPPLVSWNVVSLRPAATPTHPKLHSFGLPFGCPAPRLSPHSHFPPSSFYIRGWLYPSWPQHSALDGLLAQGLLLIPGSVSCLPTQVNFWLTDPRRGDITLSPWFQPWTLALCPYLDQGTVAAWISPGFPLAFPPFQAGSPSYSVQSRPCHWWHVQLSHYFPWDVNCHSDTEQSH